MTDQNSILDYASPRKRGRLRLPAVSALTCDVNRDSVLVEQKLAGKSSAIWGLLFGGFTLFVLLSTAASQAFVDSHFQMRSRPQWEALFVPGFVAALQISIAIAIVQQTWRRTRLWAEYNLLKLDLLSPLQRQHYVWNGDQILDLITTVTANEQSGNPLAEMLITRADGGDVRLFTDHPVAIVRDIAAVVSDIFRHGQTNFVLENTWNASRR